MRALKEIIVIGLKTLRFCVLAILAVVVVVAAFLALGALFNGSTSNQRSATFPAGLADALSRNEDINFDDHLSAGTTVCLIPEYTSTSEFLEKYGVANGPSHFVSELETMFFLKRPDETSDYLGLGANKYYLLRGIRSGCYDATGMVWKISDRPDRIRFDAQRLGGTSLDYSPAKPQS